MQSQKQEILELVRMHGLIRPRDLFELAQAIAA